MSNTDVMNMSGVGGAEAHGGHHQGPVMSCRRHTIALLNTTVLYSVQRTLGQCTNHLGLTHCCFLFVLFCISNWLACSPFGVSLINNEFFFFFYEHKILFRLHSAPPDCTYNSWVLVAKPEWSLIPPPTTYFDKQFGPYCGYQPSARVPTSEAPWVSTQWDYDIMYCGGCTFVLYH